MIYAIRLYLYMWTFPLVCMTITSCGSGSQSDAIVPTNKITAWSDIKKDGIIVGTVTDQTGKPVSQVAVYFAQYPTSLINYTDSNGTFSIANYPLGNQEIIFDKFGFAGTSVKMLLTSAGSALGTVGITFGDANVDGNVDLADVGIFEAALGVAVNNSNRYMDFDNNGRLDNVDLNVALLGSKIKGFPSREWLLSKPDYVTYIPALSSYKSFTTNQHYIVTQLNSGRLLGIWTGGLVEAADNQSMLCHWSDDGGKTWSDFNIIDGPWWGGDKIASWGFPIYIPEQNRFYVFYNKDTGSRIYHQGYIAMKYSDNGGETWSKEYRYNFTPGEYTPKTTGASPYWWAYQRPIRVGNTLLVGFTEIQPHEPDIFYSTEIRFLSFDNIVSLNDPSDLVISTFPENGKPGLRGSYLSGTARSTLQEPSIVQLSDGRLFCVMRSGQGFPYYSISSDNGKTWTSPSGLRYGDGQALVDQPLASCPIYKLSDTAYVLVFHNNTGSENGGLNAGDGSRNRTPAFIVYAKEDLSNRQPLTFSEPIRFLENYVRPYGPQNRTEIGTYPSMTVIDGTPTLWYPDRKHFLLGKRLPKPE